MVRWTLTLQDRKSGDIEVQRTGEPTVQVRGDDAALELLLSKVGDHDWVTFVRGYSPYGSFETLGFEVRRNEAQYRAGLWGFEGGRRTKGP